MKIQHYLILSITLILLGCNFDYSESSVVDKTKTQQPSTAKGGGDLESGTFSLDDFHSIGLGINANVYLTQGDKQTVKVEGEQRIIDLLSRKISGQSWNIKFTENRVGNYKTLNIFIQMPTLKSLSIGGSGDIISEGQFKDLDQVKLSIGGSGNIKLDLEAESIKSSISGSGNINLEGSAEAHNISIAGSGNVSAYNMTNNQTGVSLVGSGDVKVNPKDKLKVSIMGSGDIYYKGNPSIDRSIMGSGKLKQAN